MSSDMEEKWKSRAREYAWNKGNRMVECGK